MHDLQMARGSIEGGYNLAVGEPALLQKHLNFPPFNAVGPYTYPVLGGEKGLLRELERLYPDKHIVVTNGAKQALLAAFAAFVKVERKSSVYHAAPYWPSYPTLTKLTQGMDFGFFSELEMLPNRLHKLVCVTSPNNPDGAQSRALCDVWDAVYANWVYGWGGVEPKYRVRVGGAAKLLGLSGVRVGWLITEEDALADAARLYVEQTTSGVSMLAQHYVAWALHRMAGKDPTPALLRAREEMLENGYEFNAVLGRYCAQVRGVPHSGTGMFAYFHVASSYQEGFANALKLAKVALVTGEACGASEPGWYRMNMMAPRKELHEALRRLRSYLP